MRVILFGDAKCSIGLQSEEKGEEMFNSKLCAAQLEYRLLQLRRTVLLSGSLVSENKTHFLLTERALSFQRAHYLLNVRCGMRAYLRLNTICMHFFSRSYLSMQRGLLDEFLAKPKELFTAMVSDGER